MPPVGFEPMISAGERPQTYALDRATSGTGTFTFTFILTLFTNILQNCFLRKTNRFDP